MTTTTWHSCASAPVRRHGGRALLLGACLAWTGLAAAAPPRLSPATGPDEAGMVDVQALAPDIVVEMRYAGHDNFTGAPVPGYEANRCYLLRPAAEAVARVQARLREQGLGLVVYDCYRPAHAVRHFVAWAHGPDDPAQKARWYPNIAKPALLDGYIAETSGHSRGATVDLTLAECRDGACAPLDMGTPFDFFDTLANTDDPRPSPGQRANRERLRAAMAAEGLRNYPMEWWHFTLDPEPDPDTAYDFPVR